MDHHPTTAATTTVNALSAGITDGHQTRKNARVFLRVKRRRSHAPPPQKSIITTAADSAVDDIVACANHGRSGKRKGKPIAPERIKLSLPAFDPAVLDAKRSKRRRMSASMFDDKEGHSFLQRLSSVNLDHCEREGGNDDDEEANNDMAMLFTPSRVLKCDVQCRPLASLNDGGGDDEQRTPPSYSFDSVKRNNKKGNSETGSTIFNHQSNDDATSTESKSQAPVKPKRTVIFRKITDLRKCLDNQQQQPPGGSPSQSNRQAVSGNKEDWSSKWDERAKWLRVVDVRLEADEEDMSSCSDNSGDYNGDSVGPRVRRMRTRPSDAEEDDNNTQNRRVKKRRKLGVAVEQSQTVLESDFLDNMNADKFDTNDCILDPEVLRLIDYSLAALHNQNGGSVSPHLSFLRIDPRLGFVANTPRGNLMVNRQYHGTGNGLADGRGRTVLHFAALWGDVAGVRAAIDMGADQTILDGQGLTPAELAKLYGQEDVASAFIVQTNREQYAQEKKSHGNNEADYYYELYCLEEGDVEVDKANDTEEEKKDDEREDDLVPSGKNQRSSSVGADSPPDLARAKTWDEDEEDYNFELREGFGGWNEHGELIFSGTDVKSQEKDNIFVQRFFYNQGIDDESLVQDDDHDSNDERYDGNDYPDDDDNYDQQSLGLGSNYDDYQDADAEYYGAQCFDDNDSDDDEWQLDFRKRNVRRNILKLECNIDDEGDYSGPMLGETTEGKVGVFAYDPDLDDDE